MQHGTCDVDYNGDVTCDMCGYTYMAGRLKVGWGKRHVAYGIVQWTWNICNM